MGPQEMNGSLPRLRGLLATLSPTVPRRGFIYVFHYLTSIFKLSCLPLNSAASFRLNGPRTGNWGSYSCTDSPTLIDCKERAPSLPSNKRPFSQHYPVRPEEWAESQVQHLLLVISKYINLILLSHCGIVTLRFRNVLRC